MAEQQEDICTQIVAAEELLLREPILLGGERPRQGVRGARNILALQQVRQKSRPMQVAVARGGVCARMLGKIFKLLSQCN